MLKNKVLIVVVLGFLIPQVTFASWWNPTTWFKSGRVKQTTEVIAIPRIQEIVSSSSTIKVSNKNVPSLEDGNQKLKKELTDLKNKTKKEVVAKTPIVNNIVKKQEMPTVTPPVAVSPTTKTCLNGVIVSVNDYCTKTCLDGEIVLETLTCKVTNSVIPTESKRDTCLNDYYTKKAIENLGLVFTESQNRINQDYTRDFAVIRKDFESGLDYLNRTGRADKTSDFDYKQIHGTYESKSAELDRSTKGALATAKTVYDDEVLKIQLACVR